MNDLTIKSFNFSDTSICIEAVSEKGKSFFSEMFGFGAISANFPKSRADDFIRFSKQKGLIIF